MNISAALRELVEHWQQWLADYLHRRWRRRMRDVTYTYAPNPNKRSAMRAYGPRPR